MARATRGSERREDALSRERIVDAAIELLDRVGEDGLTFRALAVRLATGAGAIYWHIASKSELLVAAGDAVVARAMPSALAFPTPHAEIRRIAVSLFEAIDAHPWVGAQLAFAPWQTALLQIFERIGRQVQALGAPRGAQFTATSTLVSYILGVSVQNAANARRFDPAVDRAEFLESVSTRWEELDADAYPFTRSVAVQLREHDDLAEFLAGIDFILAGISSKSASEPRAAPPPSQPRARRRARGSARPRR